MMIVISSVAVALVVFILYALERRSKSEQIEWIDAGKLSLFGGLLTAGVVFASTSEIVKESIPTTEITTAIQEMFVGTPNF
jgi:hypothetical protein